MNDELNKKENKGRIARWEKIGVDAIEADLKHSNGIRYVGKHRDLAWEWVRHIETQDKSKRIFIFEPNFYGIGINLVSFWKFLTRKK